MFGKGDLDVCLLPKSLTVGGQTKDLCQGRLGGLKPLEGKRKDLGCQYRFLASADLDLCCCWISRLSSSGLTQQKFFLPRFPPLRDALGYLGDF